MFTFQLFDQFQFVKSMLICHITLANKGGAIIHYNTNEGSFFITAQGRDNIREGEGAIIHYPTKEGQFYITAI